MLNKKNSFWGRKKETKDSQVHRRNILKQQSSKRMGLAQLSIQQVSIQSPVNKYYARSCKNSPMQLEVSYHNSQDTTDINSFREHQIFQNSLIRLNDKSIELTDRKRK